MEKLCYVLIDFDADTYRHYLYLYELIDAVAARTEVFLIIEKAFGEPTLFKNVKRIHCIKAKGFVRRKIELFRVLNRAHREGFRVIYSHYSYMAAIIGGLLCRVRGGRTYFWHCIIVRHLLNDIVEMTGGGTMIAFRNWLFLQRIRLTLALVQFLVTGSDFMARVYHKELGIPLKKIKALPNWVNVKRLREGLEGGPALRNELSIPKDHQVVLFLHGLVRGKGAHFLPRIIEETVRKRPKTIFVIVGDGMMRAPMEAEIQLRGVERWVRLMGHVPNNRVAAFYGMANLFILPSWFEEFTRVLLEAMACGVPFVATDGGGGIRAYTSPTQQEYMTTIEDVFRFPQLIGRLLDNPDERRRLSEEGLKVVQEYSQERAVERFLHEVLQAEVPGP